MVGRRILGVDPGSQVTGFAVIDVLDSRSTRLLDMGCIRLGNGPLPQRLGEIFARLGEVIVTWSPSEMAIEDVFMHRSAQSALKLGQARGAAICAGRAAQLEVAEYSPKEIKQAVTGTGAADKAQVQKMVVTLLGLENKPQSDAADALAVALCHSNTNSRLAQQVPAELLRARRGRRRGWR